MKDEYVFLVQKAVYTKEVGVVDILSLDGIISDNNKEDLSDFFDLLDHSDCYIKIVPKEDIDCNKPFRKEFHDNGVSDKNDKIV